MNTTRSASGVQLASNRVTCSTPVGRVSVGISAMAEFRVVRFTAALYTTLWFICATTKTEWRLSPDGSLRLMTTRLLAAWGCTWRVTPPLLADGNGVV